MRLSVAVLGWVLLEVDATLTAPAEEHVADLGADRTVWANGEAQHAGLGFVAR